MSFPHRIPVLGDGLEDYYEDIASHWPGVETPSFMDINHPYCTAAFPAASTLTPTSLPDISSVQARPSPVLSHHSQEYKHGFHDTVPRTGLGITTAPSGDFSRTATAGLGYPSEDMEYNPSAATLSPGPPPAKRARRSYRQPPPVRDAPVSILPNPEIQQSFEQPQPQQQQQQSQRQRQPREQTSTDPHLRPRAPGRGRKDPQAEDEDAFVERLRERNVTWKAVREMFQEKYNKDATEARLQMRLLRRRKERITRWNQSDTQLLIRARDYWEQEKYGFIAQKVKELGSKKTYTPQQCEAQLQALDEGQRGGREQTGSFLSAPSPRIPDPQHVRRRAAPRMTASVTRA